MIIGLRSEADGTHAPKLASGFSLGNLGGYYASREVKITQMATDAVPKKETRQMTQTTKEQAAIALVDKVQDTTKDLYALYESQWSARSDVLKSIVTLSSGSVVLSVTFSSTLRTLNAGASWRYMIVFTFALFLMSLISSVVALFLSARLHEIQSDVFSNRRRFREDFMKCTSVQEFNAAFEKRITAIVEPLATQDFRIKRLFRFSLATFCLAIVVLAFAGGIHLLR
jgi:hypothetical protein